MKRRLIHVDVKPVKTAAMLVGETHEEVSGQAAKLTLTQMAFFFSFYEEINNVLNHIV